jgi:aspartate racemase
VLGCTEIPLALSAVPGMDALDLVDPAALLARALAQRAYAWWPGKAFSLARAKSGL